MKYTFLVSKGNINSSKGKGDTDNLNCVFLFWRGGGPPKQNKNAIVDKSEGIPCPNIICLVLTCKTKLLKKDKSLRKMFV